MIRIIPNKIIVLVEYEYDSSRWSPSKHIPNTVRKILMGDLAQGKGWRISSIPKEINKNIELIKPMYFALIRPLYRLSHTRFKSDGAIAIYAYLGPLSDKDYKDTINKVKRACDKLLLNSGDKYVKSSIKLYKIMGAYNE